MCQQHDSIDHVEAQDPGHGGDCGGDGAREPFPWDAGVFDAHCHPTDTMGLVPSIPSMKARALTVMSTRSQDQDLVHDLASEQGVQIQDRLFVSGAEEKEDANRRVIPAFGWHPWFSYQIFDDHAAEPTYDGTANGKTAHYDKILSPSPSSKDKNNNSSSSSSSSFSAGLQAPRPLSEFIKETRARLEQYPFALVGEIGLDKAFRIPESWAATAEDAQDRDASLTPGGREGRRLSPYRVNIEHQTTILKAQLRLAGEMGRAVSVHGVQVHGGVYNTISDCWKGHEREVLSRRQQKKVPAHADDFSDDDDEKKEDVKGYEKSSSIGGSKAVVPKPFPPRICLHSYSGPVNIMNQYLHKSVPAKVFFSFSDTINFDPDDGNGSGGSDKNQKTEEAIRTCPDDRILVESDLHTAGDRMDGALEAICRRVCELKGWELRKGVEQLARNYREFAFDE